MAKAVMHLPIEEAKDLRKRLAERGLVGRVIREFGKGYKLEVYTTRDKLPAVASAMASERMKQVAERED